MKIRNIRKSDYEAVDRLLLQINQVDVEGRPDLFVPIVQYMPRETFESLVENDNVIAILAKHRGEIIGCCFVSMLGRSGMTAMKTAYIDLLAVDEAYRRQGVGTALFQEVQRRARREGAKWVDLTVWSHNKVAVEVYQAFGMVPQRYVYEKRL